VSCFDAHAGRLAAEENLAASKTHRATKTLETFRAVELIQDPLFISDKKS
jgi:hypothetical protein